MLLRVAMAAKITARLAVSTAMGERFTRVATTMIEAVAMISVITSITSRNFSINCSGSSPIEAAGSATMANEAKGSRLLKARVSIWQLR